jgi:hypothetical protein
MLGGSGPGRNKAKFVDPGQFEQKASEANTLIDSFYVIGPDYPY